MAKFQFTIIIPTHNRSSSLTKLLASLSRQTQKTGYEILIIDNHSTDNTFAVYRQFSRRLPTLLYIHEPSPGLLPSRHAGLRYSTSANLVFLDDDVSLPPTWAKHLSTALRTHSQAVLLIPRVLPHLPGTSPSWFSSVWRSNSSGIKINDTFSIVDLGSHPAYTSPYFAFGCCFIVKKSLLIRAGGFHPDGYPRSLKYYRGDGETYISRYIIDHHLAYVYCPQIVTFHQVSSSRLLPQYYFRHFENVGIGESYIHIRQHNPSLSQIISHGYKLILNIFLHPFKIFFPLPLRNSLQQIGYHWGYCSHQMQCIFHPKIVQWIKKPNYLV